MPNRPHQRGPRPPWWRRAPWAPLSKLIAQVAASCVVEFLREHVDPSDWFS